MVHCTYTYIYAPPKHRNPVLHLTHMVAGGPTAGEQSVQQIIHGHPSSAAREPAASPSGSRLSPASTGGPAIRRPDPLVAATTIQQARRRNVHPVLQIRL
ncbi:hypothetical protein ACLOJK_026987 [Asimina triloba]